MNKSDFTKEQQKYIEGLLLEATITAFDKGAAKASEWAHQFGISKAMLMIAMGLLDGTMSKENVTPDFWRISKDIINGKPIDTANKKAAK